MTYRSIAVCLDNSILSQRRLEFALTLARRYEAHLQALHMTREPLVFDNAGQISPLFMEWKKLTEEKQERARALGCARAKEFGIDLAWDAYRSTEVPYLTAKARLSDIVIIGQRNPADLEADFEASFNDKFILSLGRPALVMPCGSTPPKTFDSILVAWNGSRESARALNDALPMLERAQKITLLILEGKGDDTQPAGSDDLKAFLARHGVDAAIRCEPSPAAEHADRLLHYAAAMEADLLVMGAYGHGRLGEMILGGVTRSILHDMNLPVLMSY